MIDPLSPHKSVYVYFNVAPQFPVVLKSRCKWHLFLIF